MGVEYEHFLIPKPNSFSPTAGKLLELVRELAKRSWIRTPDAPGFDRMETNGMPRSAMRTGAHYRHGKDDTSKSLPWPLDLDWLNAHLAADLRLMWPVGSLARAGLQYPLTRAPDMPAEALYYDLRMELCPDYVYRTSEIIEPFDATTCVCGAELGFDPEDEIFYQSRIHSACPKCSREIDVCVWAAAIRDGWTGEVERRLQGGATSRFAVVIDCGKAFAREGGIEAKPEFIEALGDVLGCSFRQVGNIT